MKGPDLRYARQDLDFTGYSECSLAPETSNAELP